MCVSDYPSDEILVAIKDWCISGREDCVSLLKFVNKCWKWPEYATWSGDKICLNTGGWSGNESLIRALEKNWVFWGLCWYLSQRGGHYEFCISKEEIPDASDASQGV